MVDRLQNAQLIAIQKHANHVEKHIDYGTAGFRAKAGVLDHIMFRMGLLAALRSQSKNATIGLMVTASHNPVSDNGIKLVDPGGEMLDMHWESLATRLANIPDDEIHSVLKNIIEAEKIDVSKPASVFVGRDTRPSSTSLSQAAIDGLKALGCEVTDYGVVTTPMLHFFVAAHNSQGEYGEPSIDGYFNKLSKAFRIFYEEIQSEQAGFESKYDSTIHADMANGVGYVTTSRFVELIKDLLTVNFFNCGEGELNKECGADYVKAHQTFPKHARLKPQNRAVSFDGDADRIVYYYQDSSVKFHLLDGDRIATLVAGYLKELLETMKITVKVGLVQTAYANGASTKYIREELEIPVACVDTGVKHLHRKAKEFDVGIYFEANGHGTVLFSKKVRVLVKAQREDKSLSGPRRAAARKMLAFIDMVNETVGDSLSDLLLVESVLHARGWSVEDWENTYTNLPNKMLKISVEDRSVIKVINPECELSAPEGLQESITNLVRNFTSGRAFVRPSGTEDVVRIYAEANTQANADKLATLVARLVYQQAGGIGEIPTIHSN